MTRPAEITSRADWDLLRVNHALIYRQIDDLYQRIATPESDNAKKEKEKRVSDRDIDVAEQKEQRRRRLDHETDLDGDCDPEPDLNDEPDIEEP